MCGIAGSVNYKLDSQTLKRDLYHRGPDEQTEFTEKNLHLIHARLAIVDISAGKQPMHHGDKTIIFNGEIYNHLEVRARLGLQGKTSSDTETILLAYEKIGPACLDEFDGMFIIIIYDRSINALFIARDRAGKKPCYYFSRNEQFVFASELNMLTRQVTVDIDPQHINQFLRFGALHHAATPYKDVYELPPAHYMYISLADGKPQLTRWWNIRDHYGKKTEDNLEAALSATDEALHTSIKRRVESSDLEVGAFLSGGIDSGLVTAIASQYNPTLKTFTVSFSGAYDESSLARLVAEKYGTHHTEIKITFDDLQFDVEKILSNYGEPFYDDSAIPSYYVSREARKHLTVVLNGDGADELFGGYRRYVPFAKYDFFSKSAFITACASLARKIIPFSHEKQSKLNYMYRLADLASQKGLDVYLSATTDIFNGHFQHFLLPEGDCLSHLRSEFNETRAAALGSLSKIMLMDFNSILPDILLVKMDIATMAHSLEGRSPFLGKDLLEYAPRIAAKYKINGTNTKFLLRKLAERYLPGELIHQPKRGFEVPLKQWVDKELKEIIFSYLRSPDSYANNYVDSNFVNQLLDRKVRVSDEKRAKMLYTLFALNVWHAKCVKRTA
ncbi:MAG: asparagine synthase (glutamine-hydrolyzing) [Bacteroidetes bacterium]|nr:asparagine synthase (glutamine-hydrolyzing) [Bacteroidota bacterium]